MDITKLLDVINKIKAYCAEIDQLSRSNDAAFLSEKNLITRQSNELITEMQTKYDAFKRDNFERIEKEIKTLVDLLCTDYEDEWRNTTVDVSTYAYYGFSKNEESLHALLDSINEYVEKLNSVDFDTLVPPIKVEVNGETFVTYTGDKRNLKTHDYNTPALTKVCDPKPIRDIVKGVFPFCKKALACLKTLVQLYDKEFKISEYNDFVVSSANAWLAEYNATLRNKYNQRFDQLFKDERASAIPERFFTELAEEGKRTDVDVLAGTLEYEQKINIGDLKLLVDTNTTHLSYFKESPVLSKYVKNGYISAPAIFNLRKCGNILLNINENDYLDSTKDFINQLILQYLLSFPVNRINFCLVDIDNKMEFRYSRLTNINNSILGAGVVRDDRQLENTIKDMEQKMYKINDEVISYNGVEDIYEYNEKFEANPQNVHLFVLVNYPSGMRDDIAKRVIKLLQNGPKAGIFSIIVNNKAVSPSVSYKANEYAQFIDVAEKNSLVIDKEGETFRFKIDASNMFTPKKEITLSLLPGIIEMLKNNAEKNKQTAVPLSRMFKDTDDQAASSKGIPSSAEVLDIPIGARGGEIQNLLLKTSGDGSAHAVVIGGTGSGKSNLLHTIIMNACYKYSPEELILYLVDFKGGVEFKYYEANKVVENQLPHIKLTGLTSDVEDGVAILSNLQKELHQREDIFRINGVEDIVAYRAKGFKMPRLFVIIDEIQELFEQDEKLGQKAIEILRGIFKKGRALGINILWASQNIPKAPGLKDKVLSQIGNRISLRLNEPDDALDIKIDPKVVKELNRPEKGLGVINDIRYGNDSIEFRVAYAENSENRRKYSQMIIDKWSEVIASTKQEPLFIVGDDDEPSPIIGNTSYNEMPTADSIVSKSLGSYTLQLGQDYITGRPYDLKIGLRREKENLVMAGYDIEVLRDMMGYSLLSVLMNEMTDADCNRRTKIYYANGEMINPKNSEDLYNVIRNDFGDRVENISGKEKLLQAITEVYRSYKERSFEADSCEYEKKYAPTFLILHSLQRYTDLFNENPRLTLKREESAPESAPSAEREAPAPDASKEGLAAANDFFAQGKAGRTPPKTETGSSSSSSAKMPDSVAFADAVKDLMEKGGKFGIHFIISMDNPLGIMQLKQEITAMTYKIFVKGVNANVVSQMLGDFKIANSLNNPKIALLVDPEEKSKLRVYRYNAETDGDWYSRLVEAYQNLRR